MNKILGWHFLTAEGRTGQGGFPVTAGQIMRVRPPIALCERGLHWSIRPIDALKYAPGSIVQRVQASGHIVQEDDKGVSSVRTCLWMADASAVLHEFACRVAEDALALVDNPDPRSINAIAAKRAWLRNEISDEELAEAEAEAWAATRAAAAAAAWAATRAAAAGDAAWAAAKDAAWVGARAAAWAAAWVGARAGAGAAAAARAAAGDAAAARAAAGDAAGAAAKDAAGDAALDKYNGWLEDMLLSLAPEGE